MPMSDGPAPNLTIPPLGDPQKADRYINSIVKLLAKDKVNLVQTDLSKFDLSSMQAHYRLELGEYDVEISHSIQTETNKDFYTMLFNSIKRVQNGSSDKVVLAYIHLSDDQYAQFKAAADENLERQRRKADAGRFASVMAPIDAMLNNLVQEVDPNAVPINEPSLPDELDQSPLDTS